MATVAKKPRTSKSPSTGVNTMTIQELLATATTDEFRALQAKLVESAPKEKLGKKIIRLGAPVVGTAIVAAGVTYVMTRNTRKTVRGIDAKLDHLIAGATDDNVVPMGKTGTR